MYLSNNDYVCTTTYLRYVGKLNRIVLAVISAMLIEFKRLYTSHRNTNYNIEVTPLQKDPKQRIGRHSIVNDPTVWDPTFWNPPIWNPTVWDPTVL